MKKPPPPSAIPRARALRGNPTEAEKTLWRLLREHFGPWRWRRQVPLGHAIADFASHRARLVVEVDGGQHGGPEDDRRTAMIAAQGYKVIRFWNTDVLTNPEAVYLSLSRTLAEQGDGASPPARLR